MVKHCMSTAQTKRIPIEALLAHPGHEPAWHAGHNLYSRPDTCHRKAVTEERLFETPHRSP